MLARVLMTLALLGIAAPVAAQPWRYVDKRGRVHYTNDPNKLPRNKRKRAQERLEKKRAERRAAEAAAAAAAAAASAAPTSAIAIPSASPDSKPKEPSAYEIWQDQMKAADKAVTDTDADLKAAREAALKARNTAIITPSGFNSDAHVKAIKRVEDLEKKLSSAQDARARTQKAKPRKPRKP